MRFTISGSTFCLGVLAGMVLVLGIQHNSEPEQEIISVPSVQIYGKHLNKAKVVIDTGKDSVIIDDVSVGYITDEAKVFAPMSLCK